MSRNQDADVAYILARFNNPAQDELDAIVRESVACDPSFATMLCDVIRERARWAGLSDDERLIEQHKKVYPGEEVWHFTDEEIEHLRELGAVKH